MSGATDTAFYCCGKVRYGKCCVITALMSFESDTAVTGDGGMGGLLEDLRGLEGDVISILDQEEAAAQSDSSGLI